MDELQRQQYLSAMGVPNWTPRFILAGAKISEPYIMIMAYSDMDAPEPPSGMDSVVSRVDISVASEDRIAPVAKLPTDIDESSKKVPVTDQVYQAKKTEKVQPVFCFGFIQAEGFLIINEFPITGNKELTPVHQRLLNNISLALGLGEISISAMELFEWPMIVNRQIDQGEQVAKDALQMYLAKKTAQQAVKFVLLLGETLSSYLPVGENNQFSIDGNSAAEIMDKPPGFSVSFCLNDLLMAPENKGIAWRQLQNLRDYLHSDE